MKKVLAIILMAVLCLQVCALAQGVTGQSIENEIAPRGTYLWTGNCTLTSGSNYVTAQGYTKCFSSCSEVSVTLILYRYSGGVWNKVWRDSWSNYGASSVYSPYVDITVSPGTYKLIGEYRAINGYTEKNDSETNSVTVY